MTNRQLKAFIGHMKWNYRRYITMIEAQHELDMAHNQRLEQLVRAVHTPFLVADHRTMLDIKARIQ